MVAEENDPNRFFDIEENIVDRGTAFRSAKVRHLYDWWLNTGEGRPPPRRAFDIVEHKLIVPNIVLIQTHPDGAFVFRLLGEEAIEIMGRNRTGEVIAPRDPDRDGPPHDAYYRWLAEARACGHRAGSLTFPERGARRFESVDCPLSSDGRSVDMFIGVIDLVR